jgi:hypothetical protein
MRGERCELTLQLVEPAQLAVFDRLLEKGGDERAERRQEVYLGRLEREGPAAFVARQEPEAPAFADERNDDERADPEPARDVLGQGVLIGRVGNENRPACRNRAAKGVEMRDRQDRRERICLRRRQAVPGEGDERRRLRDVANDSDALESESVGDRLAGTFED